MKPLMPIAAALLLLSACETNQQDKEAVKAQAKEDAQVVLGKAERSATRVTDTVRDNIKKTSMKLREWWLTPLPDETPTAVPSSYCYKVWQDIVCYRSAMPGMTHQLVGYQGDAAMPPPVAQMAVPPVSRIEKQNNAALGANRITTAKPVFVGIPTQPKADKQVETALDGTPQVGSEPLPDPNMSPQL